MYPSTGDQQNSSSSGPGHREAANGKREESVWLMPQQGEQQNSSSSGPGQREAASSHREESVWLRLQQWISQQCTKYNLCIALTALLIGIGVGIGVGIGKGTTTPVTCLPTCPDKWTVDNGTCYFASHDEQDYNSSKNFCEEQGASLLLLNNKTMEVVKQLRMEKTNFWIGLRRNPGEPWQWENGTLYTDIMPDDNENRNCAYFHVKIRALDCSTSHPFICVKKLKPI